VGRADAVLHSQGDGGAASAHTGPAGTGRAARGKGGIEAWQTLDVRDLDADDLGQYIKIKDTLDVWFDSGSTHQTVLGGPAGRETGAGSHPRETGFPADLYLEGSDSTEAGSILRCWCRAC